MHALGWDDDCFDVVTSVRGIWGTTPDALSEVLRVRAPGRCRAHGLGADRGVDGCLDLLTAGVRGGPAYEAMQAVGASAVTAWARKVGRDPDTTSLAFSTVNAALGALPDRALADGLPAQVRDAVRFGRPAADS